MRRKGARAVQAVEAVRDKKGADPMEEGSLMSRAPLVWLMPLCDVQAGSPSSGSLLWPRVWKPTVL